MEKTETIDFKTCPYCKGEAYLNGREMRASCLGFGCSMKGPVNDPEGFKWNSIPRSDNTPVVSHLDHLARQIVDAMEALRRASLGTFDDLASMASMAKGAMEAYSEEKERRAANAQG